MFDRYQKEKVGTEFVKVNKSKPTNYHFVLNYRPERTILIKHEDYEYDDPRDIDSRSDGFIFLPSASIRFRSMKNCAKYLKAHPNTKMAFNPGTFQLRFGPKKLKEIYRHTYALFVNREEAELILGAKRDDIKELYERLAEAGAEGGRDHGRAVGRLRVG